MGPVIAAILVVISALVAGVGFATYILPQQLKGFAAQPAPSERLVSPSPSGLERPGRASELLKPSGVTSLQRADSWRREPAASFSSASVRREEAFSPPGTRVDSSSQRLSMPRRGVDLLEDQRLRSR